MRRINWLVISGVVGFSLFLGGCVGGPAKQTDNTIAESPVVTITGKITVAGAKILIDRNGVPTEITSRKLDLASYNGKEAQVTGQFSGTVLYVDEVK